MEEEWTLVAAIVAEEGLLGLFWGGGEYGAVLVSAGCDGAMTEHTPGSELATVTLASFVVRAYPHGHGALN